MSDPLLYRMGGRGTGRTTRLVKATPTGGIYIVPSPGVADIVRGYLAQIDRRGEIEVMSLKQARSGLIGRTCPVAIDHTVFEEGFDEDMHMRLSKAPLLLTNDYEGDVITTYRERA